MKTLISWHFIWFQPATQNTLYCALRLSSRGTNQALSLLGVRGKVPWSWRLFLNQRYEKNPFPNTLSSFKQPLTNYSLLSIKAFFQRNKQGNAPVGSGAKTLWQMSISKHSVLLIQTTKVALHTITFLFGHMCLSTWAEAVVSNSHPEEKASLVNVIAPGNKISKASNKWHQSMFGNKLMTALVTLKTMVDQQSAWGSSLKGIFVVV